MEGVRTSSNVACVYPQQSVLAHNVSIEDCVLKESVGSTMRWVLNVERVKIVMTH